MSIYRKKNNQFIKLNNYVITKDNNKYFICTRTLDNGVEYYDVPESAMSSFSMFASNTIYTFLLESNTTTNPKLRYGQAVLDIKVEGGQLEVGQLNGILQLYTKNITISTDIYLLKVVRDVSDYATQAFVEEMVQVTDEPHTIQTTDWTVIGDSSVEPFLYQTTVISSYNFTADTESEIINDNPVLFVKAGFSIISRSGSSITIYSFLQPSNNVTLTLRFKELVRS